MKKISCLTTLMVLLSLVISAQNTIFQTIQNQQTPILQVTIQSNWDSISNNRNTETTFPATFSYRDQTSKELVSYQAKLEVRGKYRRKICDFPPVKIKFDKNDLKKYGIRTKHKSLKLVTHCLEGTDFENVTKEYLVYKLFNELTDKSLNVQLMRILYLDESGKRYTKQYGFLIEDVDEFAERFDAEECDDCFNFQSEQVEPKQEALVAAFQYMIGNADWSLKTTQNIKIIKPNDGSKPFIVPYDFDFSGLVNSQYAVPNSNHGLRHIKDRIYLGDKNPELIDKIVQFIDAKQEDLFHVIESARFISVYSIGEMSDYLKMFFSTMTRLTREEYVHHYN